MRSLAPAFMLVLTFAAPGFGQNDPIPINLEKLRTDVSTELLNERQTPMVEVVDHFWKSNGGALVTREYASTAGRKLANDLVRMIEYDPETATLYWPIYGFSDPRAVRFTPAILWNLIEPALASDQVPAADLPMLKERFINELTTRPIRYDPLVPPQGLSMPAGCLLNVTGYFGPRLFVYSPSNCFDVALKCYQLGLYQDAIVLLSHALAQTQDAKCYYLRGVIEMWTGRAEDAKMSALGIMANRSNPATSGPNYVYERVNGPAVIQFRDLIADLSSRAPPILP